MKVAKTLYKFGYYATYHYKTLSLLIIIQSDFSRKKLECTTVNVTCGNKLALSIINNLSTVMHFPYIDVTKYYTQMDGNCHNNNEGG